MKQSKICPKCQSTDILRVEGSVGQYGAGNNLRIGMTHLSSIALPRYVCCDCGYAEEWVDRDDLHKLRDQLPKQWNPWNR